MDEREKARQDTYEKMEYNSTVPELRDKTVSLIILHFGEWDYESKTNYEGQVYEYAGLGYCYLFDREQLLLKRFDTVEDAQNYAILHNCVPLKASNNRAKTVPAPIISC